MNKAAEVVAIHVADVADAATVARLRSLADGAAADRRFVQRVRDWLVAEGSRRTTWLASRGGAPVGMISLLEYRRMPHADRRDSSWGYVSNLFVSPGSRRAGIGAALIDHVIEVAGHRGYVRLVLSASDEALPLFRRAGFIEPQQTGGAIRLLVRPEPTQ